MAATTYTSTVYTAGGVKDVFIGNQSLSGSMVYSGSVGDVLLLAKVPHGAKIVDFYEYHSSGQTAAAISFGFDRGIAAGGAGNASCLLASGAIATMNRMSLAAAPGGAPLMISLSDLDPVRYAALVGKAESGTFSITVSIGWCLTYRKDGPDPA